MNLRSTFTLGALTLLSASSLMSAQTPQEEAKQEVPAALKIIKAWKNPSAKKEKRVIHVVYWCPSDRKPAPDHRKRLTAVMLEVQAFYAEGMEKLGFGRQTVNLDLAADKLIQIHEVKGRHPYSHYKYQSGDEIRNECRSVIKQAGIDMEKETIVLFINMSNWDPKKKKMTQNSPYYATGNPRNGFAWQVDSPILDPRFLSKKQPIINDGQYGDISIGKYNSIFSGGVIHELGHALGLAHCAACAKEKAAFGTALMGLGNHTYGENLRGEGKGTFLTLTNGLRLTTHPIFSGTSQGLETYSKSTLSHLRAGTSEVLGEKAFVVTGKIETPKEMAPAYAIIAYCDPEGGKNYDATTASAIPNSKGEFTLNCIDLKPNSRAVLRMVVLHANGDASSHVGPYSPFMYNYSVDANGKPNTQALDFAMMFSGVKQAVQQKNEKQLDAELLLLKKSKNKKVVSIASRLLVKGHLWRAPALLPVNKRSVALGDTTPAEAKIGYGTPLYNRMPSDSMILQASGQTFEHGIYSHAPARHIYHLDGQWKTLKGQCGLAENSPGSVRFVIKADGKELWKSPVMRENQLQSYEVDIASKKNLELIVEDGGDGNRSDWGLWLEPVLER